MARKKSGRGCPTCGAPVQSTQKFCAHCGTKLQAGAPAKSSGGFQALLGKLFVGAIAILFVLAIIGRLLDDPTSSPTPQPESAGMIDPVPTRTSRPATHTPVPPSFTAAPLTQTALPEERDSSRPTDTPSPVPTMRVVQTLPQSDTAVRQTVQTEEAAPARTPEPPPTGTQPPAPTEIPSSPTPVPSNTPEPPTPTAIPPAPTVSGLAFAPTDCSGYDAWEWAQSVYEADPVTFAGLDVDGDGTACPNLTSGFAPAFWTSSLPSGITQGNLDAIIDGDTFEITVNGQTSRYRLYRADTPEVGENVQCGGQDATEFVRYALSFNDTPGQIWVEEVGQRDPYGRKLAYLWFTVAGEPYLLNHVLINNGWAENIDYGDDFDPYPSQLDAAASFAQKHRLGVWEQCGGFDQPLPTPTPFPTQAPKPTEAPFAPPTQAPMNLGGGSCDPNYTPCVPLVDYDLDCPDIGMQVQVIGIDRHGFDREGDGRGCESW